MIVAATEHHRPTVVYALAFLIDDVLHGVAFSADDDVILAIHNIESPTKDSTVRSRLRCVGSTAEDDGSRAVRHVCLTGNDDGVIAR